jgi:uncharacterized membrane protein YagU involved in acid resistance
MLRPSPNYAGAAVVAGALSGLLSGFLELGWEVAR